MRHRMLVALLPLLFSFAAAGDPVRSDECRRVDLDGTGTVDARDLGTLLENIRDVRGTRRRLARLRAHLGELGLYLRCAGAPVRHNVLVIGLDSARWELLDILMAGGHLPTIERLAKSGSRGAMWCFPAHPQTACFCPPVWTTLSTGHTAERHGLVNGSLPNTERRVKALWDVLDEHGGTTTLSAYRHSWPPPPSVDYVLTGQGAEHLGSRMFTMFERLFPLKLAVAPDDPTYTKPRALVDEHGLYPPEGDAKPPAWRPFARDRASMRFMDLVTREYGTTDLTMILFHSPDKASHVTWADIQERKGAPLNEAVVLDRADAWKQPLVWLGNPASQYIEIDRWLGGFLERNHYSYVVFVSDHGMARSSGAGPPGHHKLDLPEAHFGIFSITGPGVRADLDIGELSLLDVVPTLAYALGLPVSEELPGSVLESVFSEEHLRLVPITTVPSWEP